MSRLLSGLTRLLLQRIEVDLLPLVSANERYHAEVSQCVVQKTSALEIRFIKLKSIEPWF